MGKQANPPQSGDDLFENFGALGSPAVYSRERCQEIARTIERIQELKREGLTVILSEQNLRFATQLADRAYIIEKGHIRYEGTMVDHAADDAVRNAYLTV